MYTYIQLHRCTYTYIYVYIYVYVCIYIYILCDSFDLFLQLRMQNSSFGSLIFATEPGATSAPGTTASGRSLQCSAHGRGPENGRSTGGVGIDVPIVGDWFHITFKYLLDIISPSQLDIISIGHYISGVGIDVPIVGDWFHITSHQISIGHYIPFLVG